MAEVKSDGPLEIESKGKTVSKEGTSDNAAVRKVYFWGRDATCANALFRCISREVEMML